MFQSHFMRIWKNRLSRIVIVFLITIPSLEIVQYFVQRQQIIQRGGEGHTPKPVFAIFQSAQLTPGVLHSLYFWFLPMFLLLMVADDVLTDMRTGIYDVLVLKIGRKKYCIEKIITSFLVSFVVVVTGLLLNFVIVHIVFRGGDYSQVLELALDIDEDLNPMFAWSVGHPYITDFIFILLAGIISGMAGAMGAAVSLFFKNKKIAYIVAFVLWQILGLQDLSLFLIFQPYSEYLLQEYIQIFVCYFILYGGSIALILSHEIRKKEYIR